MPYTAKINGAFVNVQAGSLDVVNQIGQRSTGSLKIWGPLGTIYQYGTQVQVYDENNALAYSGFTTKDKARKSGGARQGTGYLEHDIQLMDNCYKADKRRARKSYIMQTSGYIVNDLLSAYLAPEGVSALPGSIATGIVIPEARWSGASKSVSEALTWLAQQNGYWWDIDVNNHLFFLPYGGVPAPFSVDGTDVDALQDLSVEGGNDMYINQQLVRGGFAEKGSKTNQLYQKFTGDGHSRSFTLPYGISHLYQLLLNGADITANSLTKGQTGGQFYYASGDPVLAQDTAQAILASTDTLEVYYTGRYPVLAQASNPTLITAQRAREGGGTGLVESAYNNSKLRSLAASQQVAGALLTHYGQDTTVLTFATRTKGFVPGQMLTVNLPDFGLNNKQMLINSVGIDDQGSDGFSVWFRIKAIGSPYESANWQTYFQNLMAQSADPNDLSDTSDTSLALLSDTIITRTASVVGSQLVVQAPICNVNGGPHTFVCGNWKCA